MRAWGLRQTRWRGEEAFCAGIESVENYPRSAGGSPEATHSLTCSGFMPLQALQPLARIFLDIAIENGPSPYLCFYILIPSSRKNIFSCPFALKASTLKSVKKGA